jgi:hypothetical protein
MPITSPQEPPSVAAKLEHDAELAGVATAEGLRAVEIAAVVVLGLLVCPPLAILVVVVAVPMLIIGLLVAVLTAPYLLVHHLRARHRGHASLLGHRLRRAARALGDAAPHRVVADVRRGGAGR